MASLNELYQNVILEHNRSPRNYRSMPDASGKASGHNPLCGDQVTVWIRMNGDVIDDVSFEGAGCAIILPVDAIVAFHFQANAPSHAYGIDAIPAEGMMLDIGDQSIERIKGALDEAATLVWNGPVGAFELHPFEKATVAIAKYAAARTKAGKLVSVAGGGDTVAALNVAGVAEQFTYVSTAGGAFLEWMEGKVLPGVAVLRQK